MLRLTLIIAIFAGLGCAGSIGAKEIIYESEYQVLVKQHGEKWAAEDREIEALIARFAETARVAERAGSASLRAATLRVLRGDVQESVLDHLSDSTGLDLENHGAALFRDHVVVLVEDACILRQRSQRNAERTERLAIWGVSVCRGDDIGSCLVNSGV